jgi:asparaginyl-tRNA synthetase
MCANAYERITYTEALEYISISEYPLEFGANISGWHERVLTARFGKSDGKESPIWITHKPRATEVFPYLMCQGDKRLTMIADLTAPDGFGKILRSSRKIIWSR